LHYALSCLKQSVGEGNEIYRLKETDKDSLVEPCPKLRATQMQVNMTGIHLTEKEQGPKLHMELLWLMAMGKEGVRASLTSQLNLSIGSIIWG
jgi:hypothetical protein